MFGVSTSELPWQAKSIQPRSSAMMNKMFGRLAAAPAAWPSATKPSATASDALPVQAKFSNRKKRITV